MTVLVAWSVAAFGLFVTVAIFVLDAANGHRFALPVTGAFVEGAFITVGALVASRRPRNPIGWIYLVGMVLVAIGGYNNFAEQYALYALDTRPGSLPGPEWVLWFGRLALMIGFFGVLFLTLLLFPDGRLPSRRWVPVAAMAGVGLGTESVISAFRPGPLSARFEVSNPLGQGALSGFSDASDGPLTMVLILVTLACIAAPIVRSRRASGPEREQLKWFAYGAAWIAFVAVVGVSLNTVAAPWLDPALVDLIGSNLWPLSILGLPIATAIAILRYRLYDIDLLINRTLVYGALSAALGATYFGAVAVLQTALRPLTGESEFAVAGSTLAVVALFAPLRRRIQAAVDRRFYRSRYDAARTLDAFGARLRDEVDLDSVRADLLEVVGTTLRPAHASVWLRERRG